MGHKYPDKLWFLYVSVTAELLLLHIKYWYKNTYDLKNLDVHLQEHVSWFYSTISSYCSSLHDRADVNAAISTVITLANNTDTKEVVLFCQGQSREKESLTQLLHTILSFMNQIKKAQGMLGLPMLSVTVMMLRLMVESVILLKEEDCKDSERRCSKVIVNKSNVKLTQSNFSTATWPRSAYPVHLGHFVPPSASLVSAHEVRRRTLFCGTAEPETQKRRGKSWNLTEKNGLTF